MRAVLDHVVVDVRDELDAAAAACERLGFTVNDASENSLGMINRLCVFQNAYVELLGVGPRAQGEQRDWLRNPAGGNGLVFRTVDAPATATELARRGLTIGAARSFSRTVVFDGVPAVAQFDTVHTRIPDAAPLRTYFCRHHTPELIWRAPSMKHANGAVTMSGVSLIARDPSRVAEWMAQAFDGVTDRVLHAENAEIDVASGSGLAEAFGVRSAEDSRSCAIRALTIRTADLDGVRAIVRASGHPALYSERRVIVEADPVVNLVFAFVATEGPD